MQTRFSGTSGTFHAMTQHAAMDMDGAGETYGQALFRSPALCLGAARNVDPGA